MKVKELIAKLLLCDPEKVVLIEAEGCSGQVHEVDDSPKKAVILL